MLPIPAGSGRSSEASKKPNALAQITGILTIMLVMTGAAFVIINGGLSASTTPALATAPETVAFASAASSVSAASAAAGLAPAFAPAASASALAPRGVGFATAAVAESTTVSVSFSELFLSWWDGVRRLQPGSAATALTKGDYASQIYSAPVASVHAAKADSSRAVDTSAAAAAAAAVASTPAPSGPVVITSAAGSGPVAAPWVPVPPSLPPRSDLLSNQVARLGVPETYTYRTDFTPPANLTMFPLPAGWTQPRARADPFPKWFAPAPAPRALPAAGSAGAYGVTSAAPGAAAARVFAPLAVAPAPADPSAAERRAAVVAEAKFAWESYAAKCFGKDELIPTTGGCKDWMGAALQIIDALSTLHLMGLHAEFKAGRDWVAANLRFDRYTPQVSFFETTIRIVGGLLSAYDMTGDVMFLDKCVDIGYRLTAAWNIPGLPMPKALVSLINGATSQHSWSPSLILSEIGTVQMEYFTLTALTGDNSFHSLADAVFTELRKSAPPTPGLYPLNVRASAPMSYQGNRVTLGGLSDSFYEYLLKMWVLTGRTQDKYRDMYVESADALIKHLYMEAGGVGFVTEHPPRGAGDRESMEHLACFAGGMFAYGVHTNAVTDPAMRARHMHAARKITEGCVLSYLATETGVGAENFFVSNTSGISTRDGQYHLRPETVESVFYLWRVTKEQKYRDWGYRIFEAVKRSCRIEGGYVGLSSVDRNTKGNAMETFLLAETFKYLFLLFSDDAALDIDTWVLNTEAHPVRARPWVQSEDPAPHMAAVAARHGNAKYVGPHQFTFSPLP